MKRFITALLILSNYGLINASNMFCADSSGKQQNCISKFENSWFSQHLEAAKENSLYYSSDSTQEIYRFTWLRTFHNPYIFTIVISEKNSFIIVKKLDGAGGYKPGKLVRNDTLKINSEDKDMFIKSLEESKFWTLETNEKVMGLDGAEWLLEGRKKGNYHLVKRWSPKNGNFRESCLKMLQISNVKENEIY